MIDFHARLLEAFPENTFAATLRGLREGVAIADEVMEGVPIFGNPVGRDIRGLIRRAGVLHRLQELCKMGDLPFASAMSQMPRGRWHWLEMTSANVKAHVVRTEDEAAFPEDTPNRQDERARYQGDLFDEPTLEALPDRASLYAWLCYGVTRAGQLTHVCWGMPSASDDEWLARINVLAEAISRTPEEVAPEHRHDPKSIMKLREDLLERFFLSEEDLKG